MFFTNSSLTGRSPGMPSERGAPLISVIVPAFNAEATLTQTVETVRAQTLDDWEIVVCDDGSTDDTPRALAELAAAEPRLRAVRQPNAGAGAARNTALAQARGRLIKFLDADDCLEPRCLEALAPLASRFGAACGVWSIDDHDARPVGITVDPGPEPVGLDRLLSDNPVAPSAAMVSREVMSLEPFRAVPAAADYDLWLRLAAHGVAWRTTPEPVARYRLLSTSNSKKCAAALQTVADCLREAYDRAQDDPVADASPQRLARVLRAHAIRYSTLHALLRPSPTQEEAADLFESVQHGCRDPMRGTLIGDAAFESALSALARRPTLANSESWAGPLSAWWSAVDHEDWAEPGFAVHAIDRLARRMVSPHEVIDRLLDGLAGPFVLVGYGANGRAIEQRATQAGLDFTVRDDRFKAGATHPRAEAMDDPIGGRPVVISPLADGPLAPRFPGARRWSVVAAQLAEDLPLALRSALLTRDPA